MKLTPREKDVLGRVCDGATTKTIAHELGVSEQAVKAHIGHLFRKFGVTNRASLAAAATNARVLRRQAISDRYHERARALGRENAVLRTANAALRSRQSAGRQNHVPRTVRAGMRRPRTRLGTTAGR